MPREILINGQPMLDRPISKKALRAEIDELLRKAKLDPSMYDMQFTKERDRSYEKTGRSCAAMWWGNMEVEGTFEFAQVVLRLPKRHRRGIIAHEIGHVLAMIPKGPWHTEDDADRYGSAGTGVSIAYDHRWPGKGLQYDKGWANQERIQAQRLLIGTFGGLL